MRKTLFRLISLLVTLLHPASTIAAQTPDPGAAEILAPVTGQALQGVVPVRGTAPAENFAFAELAFSYAEDPAGTLFLIGQFDRPVIESIIAEWDTSRITDGNYNLHLIVTQADGSRVRASVTDLRVRNYTAIETSTPSPTVTATAGPTRSADEATALEGATQAPTPTDLPANPARITTGKIAQSLLQGFLVVAGAFVLLGLYLGLRAAARR